MNSEIVNTTESTEDDEGLYPYEEELSNSEMAVSYEHSSMHIGPIPSPEVLAEYNKIDPTFANRILVMAEQQSLHRQEIEKRIVKSGVNDSKLGIIFGFIIGLAALIVSLVLGLNGRTIASSLLGVSGLVGLVSVFIYGTRSNGNEDKS
ncbi:putative membrane protein [Lachnotalea glycerini]|uniref:Putative membrane protein n=1 Tax=Lachnotalea glycerini TaxID=1763509 RepID=A0A318EGM7_9FIRM|nr:DUF2335 domain-containing protein [Lachnotalea glycerini]PXV85105.1 putative membrane protein [Lachnotalea glycerini]